MDAGDYVVIVDVRDATRQSLEGYPELTDGERIKYLGPDVEVAKLIYDAIQLTPEQLGQLTNKNLSVWKFVARVPPGQIAEWPFNEAIVCWNYEWNQDLDGSDM